MRQQVRVTLKKSLIGSTKQQKASAFCLGLRRPGQSAVLTMDSIRKGQINRIKHLILLSPVSSIEQEDHKPVISKTTTKKQPVEQKMQSEVQVQMPKKSDTKGQSEVKQSEIQVQMPKQGDTKVQSEVKQSKAEEHMPKQSEVQGQMPKKGDTKGQNEVKQSKAEEQIPKQSEIQGQMPKKGDTKGQNEVKKSEVKEQK